MSNYKTIIGLEVHVELKTKTKMFCGCSSEYFAKEPNTQTCPTCLGLPGSLPFINQEALDFCIKIGLALNCKVNTKSLFERKNYFYPDLPKGYQISQYRWPLCASGYLLIASGQNEKKIRINRVHQEEDTGKLLHQGDETLIDFNRSGVPLVEIVTEPDFESSEEVKIYAKKLQQILRTLGVSNADMEKGELRLEANVSVRPERQTELPNYRVELKNINSFSFVGAAIDYEIKRQIDVLEKGETIKQHTRGWDQDKKETYIQREKEEANDYRYFPEPDLQEVVIDEARIKKLESSLPKLPEQKVQQLIESGLPENLAFQLVSSNKLELFDTVVKSGMDPLETAKVILNNRVAGGVDEIVGYIKGKGVGVISDEGQLNQIAEEVITENPKLVQIYKSGKTTVIMALVGQVMQKTSGKADAVKVKEILEKLLV